MSSQQKLSLVFVALTVAALWQVGLAGWIHIKASLAQVLLDRAWQQALTEGRNVRPWPWADTWPIAELSVPRLSISDIVLAGDSAESLAFGPGHSFASKMPSDDGTMIISGHRDTHFNYLQYLEDGDRLLVKTRTAIHYYTVYKTEVVDSQYVKVDTNTSGLILATCYPFNAATHGGSKRFLVHAHRAHEI